jgi:hypothetical protein
MTTTTAPTQRLSTTADAARRATLACWMLGAILLAGGGAIAGTMLTESTGGLLAGLALLGVGQLVVLVAIVATGVRLGVEGARR